MPLSRIHTFEKPKNPENLQKLFKPVLCAMHNSYSIASIDKRYEALAVYLPIGGGAEGGGGSTSGKKSHVEIS